MKNYLLSLSVVLLIVGFFFRDVIGCNFSVFSIFFFACFIYWCTTEDVGENEDVSENKNEIIKISAIYEDFKDSKFSFVYNEEDEKYYLIFNAISKEILSEYDLKSDKFKGQKFKVNYKIETSDDNEILTLMRLKKTKNNII